MEPERRSTFVVGRKIQNHLNPSLYAPRKYNSHNVTLPPTLRPKTLEQKQEKHKHMDLPPTRGSKHTVIKGHPTILPTETRSKSQVTSPKESANKQDPSRIINDLSMQIITTALINGLQLEQFLADLTSSVMAKVNKSLQPDPAPKQTKIKQDESNQTDAHQPEQAVDQPEQAVEQPEQVVDQPEQVVEQLEQAVDQPKQAVDQSEQMAEKAEDLKVDQLEDLPQPSEEPE